MSLRVEKYLADYLWKTNGEATTTDNGDNLADLFRDRYSEIEDRPENSGEAHFQCFDGDALCHIFLSIEPGESEDQYLRVVNLEVQPEKAETPDEIYRIMRACSDFRTRRGRAV